MAEPMDMNSSLNSVEQQVFDQSQQPQESQPQSKTSPEFGQLAAMISDIDRRLRVLEERHSNLRKKLQLTDQNLLDSEKSFSKELRALNDESVDTKRAAGDFADKLGMFSSELDNTAQKSDLKVIEKYLDLWDPANFVTRNQLKQYLKEEKNERE